jgi:hypothetical protein
MLAAPTGILAANRRMRTKKRDVIQTKVCSFFEAGNCRKGTRCDFIHSPKRESKVPRPASREARQPTIEDRVCHLMPWLASREGFAPNPVWPSEESTCAGVDEQDQLLSGEASEGTASEASDEEWRLSAEDDPMSVMILEGGYVIAVKRLQL